MEEKSKIEEVENRFSGGYYKIAVFNDWYKKSHACLHCRYPGMAIKYHKLVLQSSSATANDGVRCRSQAKRNEAGQYAFPDGVYGLEYSKMDFMPFE